MSLTSLMASHGMARTQTRYPLKLIGMSTGNEAIIPTIHVSRADIQAACHNVHGLTFKGFGVLSANSTSALLPDYRALHPGEYWQMIRTLFAGSHPLFDLIKIEMGNDRNNSTGACPCTMRRRDEIPNVRREFAFQMAADANSVADRPVKVSLLRWKRPAWVKTDRDQYIWFKNTALIAYRTYGYMVDSINPDANETQDPSPSLYRQFAHWIRTDETGYESTSTDDPHAGFSSPAERRLFHQIRVIAADCVGTPPLSFGDEMTGNPEMTRAVDIVGFHYSDADDAHGSYTQLADSDQAEIWMSEGQATFGTSADRPSAQPSSGLAGPGSALEMADWLTTGFTLSRRTLAIYQPAIGACYDGTQYSSKELVSARDPWSGWIYYDAGLAVLAHFVRFARAGWENSSNSAGVWRAIPQASFSPYNGGNPPRLTDRSTVPLSWMTLASPDTRHFSTVIVNESDQEQTVCILVDHCDQAPSTVHVWQTRAASAGKPYDAHYLEPIETVQASDVSDSPGCCMYRVHVAPFSIATATTLDLTADQVGHLPHTRDTALATGTRREDRPVLMTRSTVSESAASNSPTVLYADDFTYDDLSDDPDKGIPIRFGQQINGAFEALAAHDTHTAHDAHDSQNADGNHPTFMRQQITRDLAADAWNDGDPLVLIGDGRWLAYRLSCDIRFEHPDNAGNSGTARQNTSQYASLCAHHYRGSGDCQGTSAVEFRLYASGMWELLHFGVTEQEGLLTSGFTPRAWHHCSLTIDENNNASISCDGMRITSRTHQGCNDYGFGRIGIGSSFDAVDFAHLRVTSLSESTGSTGSHPAFYSQLIDDMHARNWDDGSDVLTYSGSWHRAFGQDMYTIGRTLSQTSQPGASVTCTFTGTGLDFIGLHENAVVSLRVDDQTADERVIHNSGDCENPARRQCIIPVRGLPNETHTITLSLVRSGSSSPDQAALTLDAIGVIS